jgi:hypothetical protein
MVRSASQHFVKNSQLEFVVFTDQVKKLEIVSAEIDRCKVRVIEVAPLRWPEATLLRYSLISDHLESVDCDIAAHLDADMIFVDEVGEDLFPRLEDTGLAFVRHPGYFRKRPYIRNLLVDPKSCLADLKGLVTGECGFGNWERRKLSSAYVPPNKRRIYVCGGVWFGSKDKISSLTRELAKRTQQDLDRGVTARWHDESYLNWYAAYHDYCALDAEYCFDEGSYLLRGLRAKIEAVNKGPAWERH